MNSSTRSAYLPWFAVGAGFTAVLLIFAWYARRGGATVAQLASKATRIDLVERMQAGLVAGAEAEKSAVLATTDAESLALANEARGATAEVAREQAELQGLLAAAEDRRESGLLEQFSSAFSELRRVDDEVLALAVRNTNLKAYDLLFGPAADTQTELDASLERIVRANADGMGGRQVLELAFRARLGALRIQTLLAPHIAEASNAKMDQLEAQIAKEEVQVRDSLDGLAKLTTLVAPTDVGVATSAFARYEEIKGRILPLSRENTNVRSLAISLNQKRKAMTRCLETLGALREVMLDEPIAGVRYGRAAKPR